MSIKFKPIAKGQPGVVGGGDTKFYASIVRTEPVSLETFAHDLADRSTLTQADIHAVLVSFMEKFPEYLMAGRSIYLGKLGSLAPAINSQAELSADEVDRYSITRLRVLFRPSNKLKDILSVAKYKKIGTNGADIVN